MKKISSIFLLMMLVITIASTSVFAVMDLIGASVNLKDPVAGQAPEAVTAGSSLVKIQNVRWDGLDENGCFIPGADYTFYADVVPGSNYQFKIDDERFAITLGGGRNAEITELTPRLASIKYTFKNDNGIDFQPDEYGTAVANRNLSIYSLANIGSSTGEKIPEGTQLNVLRAFAPTTTSLKCHMVEYKGKVVYIMLWSSDKTPAFRDVKVEGKLDPNNIPEDRVPKHESNAAAEQEKPAQKGYEYKNLGIWKFTATAGKAPEISFSTAKDLVKSVVFSEDIVQKPYARVTATVTYSIENGKDYFTENPEVKILESNTICGYEIVSKSKDTVVVKYTTVSDNGETKADITQEMKDFMEYMANNSITRIPTKAMGKLDNFTGNARLYDQPLMFGNVNRNAPPKIFYIHDIQHHIADLSEDWYYISDLRGIHGFIPAVYVTDITEYEYFANAPGTNKRTPFEFAGGSGTINDPYLIETAEQLNSVRYKPTMHYKLIADIDLSSWGNWTPIGGTPAYGGYPNDSVNKAQQSSAFFSGSLDGNGHAISGMQIIINEDKPYMYEGGNSRYYGLFAIITEGEDHDKPTISNLDLVNYKIDISYNNVSDSVGSDQYWLGSFAASCLAVKIENCHAYNGSTRLHFTDTDGTVVAGGIAGECSDSTLTRCSNSGDITISVANEASSYSYTLQGGGITGKITDSNNFTECYNSGDITLPLTGTLPESHWTDSYAGGISSETAPVLDSPNTTYITNCYNSGNITARAVNDIVVYNGTSTKLYVKNFYNVGELIYNPAEEGAEPGRRDKLIPTTFKTNCASHGNAVSGAEWQKSDALGRMVLKCRPEDMPARSTFNFAASIVGGFADVKSDEWYAESVKWAVDKKITAGTSETTFSPDNTCTRAQILTFLWRAAGSPKMTSATPFSDVKDSDYYYGAALWAYENGMISGNVFGADIPCTRRETVVYIWKYDGSSKEASYSGTFTDVSADDECATAVAWAVKHGITGGTSPTTFSPNDTCTRGQIVTFLYRAFR